MGQVTPNMGIYIPAAGETNYDASFAAGMINVACSSVKHSIGVSYTKFI
jgi:NOL1/NOP2/fmu family ribosome biogenesis protein